MDCGLPLVVACLTLLVILCLAAGPRRRDGFYTEFAREEPTRSYVPYTGTLPFGDWEQAHLPWAEMAPHPPHRLRSLWGPGATFR